MMKMEIAIFALIVVLQALDAWTTIKILARGGVELNPILEWDFSHIGELPTVIALKCLLLGAAIALLCTGWRYSICVLASIGLAYVVIVIHNFRQL